MNVRRLKFYFLYFKYKAYICIFFTLLGRGEMEDKIKEYVDGVYEPAKEWVVKKNRISTTMLQRRFRIGYTKAAKIINLLEENNIIGTGECREPRIVLVNK